MLLYCGPSHHFLKENTPKNTPKTKKYTQSITTQNTPKKQAINKNIQKYNTYTKYNI